VLSQETRVDTPLSPTPNPSPEKKMNVVKISHVIVAQYPAESIHFLQKQTADRKKMFVLHQR
jgi:hypothetical protein